MDAFQLRLFVSVAQTLNFSRTSEQFFISQPTVSHHIKMLEDSLGAKLLNRTSKKISLTDEGSEFLRYASQAVDLIASGESRVKNMALGRTGHLRIAALSSISNHLSASLTKLYKQYPTVQVDVDLLEGSELIDSIKKERHDFYFSIDDMLLGAEDYEHKLISEDKLMLFVNEPIANTIDINDWSTIEVHPFVSIKKSDTWLSSRIRLICKNHGIVPNIVSYYNRAETAVLGVNAGIGIAILPGGLKRLYQYPSVVTLPIQGNNTLINYVLAWKSGKRTTAGDIFKDIVLSMFNVNTSQSTTDLDEQGF